MGQAQSEQARGLGDPRPYLLSEETVVVGVRRHLLVLAAALAETLGFIAAALMLMYLLEYTRFVDSIAALLILAALVRFAYLIIEWRMERFVITNQRMMLISGVITRRVAAVPLRKVTDLTFEKTIMGQLFGYGTFIIESAGQDQAMARVEYLPHANRLYLKVSDLLFGAGMPAVEADLLADRRTDYGEGDYLDADRRDTDPNLGVQLAGIDFDDDPSWDPYLPEGARVPELIRVPESAGDRLRSRLGGINGRGRRRGRSGEPDDGPITKRRPSRFS